MKPLEILLRLYSVNLFVVRREIIMIWQLIEAAKFSFKSKKKNKAHKVDLFIFSLKFFF